MLHILTFIPYKKKKNIPVIGEKGDLSAFDSIQNRTRQERKIVFL